MKVSICLATYNRSAKVLREVFDSIFSQRPPFDFEVIVCDDGSPSKTTKAVCRKYPIKYYRINRPPGRLNPCVPRNVTYRAARGDIVICQSDDVVHKSSNAIEKLVWELERHPGTFIIATVLACSPEGKPWSVYTGTKRQMPWFFLGALWRRDLYAVGGNDEDFRAGPAFDDEWFARCLQNGLELIPYYTGAVTGYHLYHPETSTKATAKPNQELGREKTEEANRTGIWCSRGGPWHYPQPKPRLVNPSHINSLTVCVEYDDLLAITLPKNKKHFRRTLVITSPEDNRTQAVAEREGCECFITEAFYSRGAWFNKGLAIEQALDAMGREGWICYWDADILMPDSISQEYNPECLYTPFRRVLVDPTKYHEGLDWSSVTHINPRPNEFPGYFHLFHSKAAGMPPWYATSWSHAGGCDSDFEGRYRDRQALARPNYKVLHLGSIASPTAPKQWITRVGQNWCGRVTPRIDGQESSRKIKARKRRVEQMVKTRLVRGISSLQTEQLALPRVQSKTIPKRITFVWAGRMSWLRWLTLHSFVTLNPGWEVRLYRPTMPPIPKHWTMNTDDDHLYQGKDYQDLVPDSIEQYEFSTPIPMASPQMCGWFRWQVLSKLGGFFCDMDILWVKPLEEIWKKVKDSDAVFCLETGWLAVGFMASKPDCVLFHDIALSKSPRTTEDYQYYGVNTVYPFSGVRDRKRYKAPGREALRRLRGHYSPSGRGQSLDIVEMPDVTVYPFDWTKIDHIWKSNIPVNPNTFGLHWFGGAKVSRKYSHRLGEDNWRDSANTMRNYLELIL